MGVCDNIAYFGGVSCTRLQTTTGHLVSVNCIEVDE